MPYMNQDYSSYFSYKTCAVMLTPKHRSFDASYIQKIYHSVSAYPICDIVFISDQTCTYTAADFSMNLQLCWTYTNRIDTHTYKISGRQYFRDKEIMNKEKVACIPCVYMQEMSESVQYKNENLSVVGVYSSESSSYCYIPTPLLIELSPEILQINFIFEDPLSAQEFRQFTSDFSQIEDISYIEMVNSEKREINLQYSIIEIVLLGILFCISMVSFIYFMKYIDDKNRYISVIYMLSGAAKERIAEILLLQKLFTILLISGASIMIHAILQKAVFAKINFLSNIYYSALDYMIIFLFMILLSVFTMLPQLISFMRRPINTSKTRSC